MLTAIKDNRSLTFYQIPPTASEKELTAADAVRFPSGAISCVATETGNITSGFNRQLNNYISYNRQTQQSLFARTQAYMDKVYASNPSPTASCLRDKSTWAQVKRFVTREELMKLQIGGEADLPLSNEQLADLRAKIADKDLTSMSDKELESMIDGIIRPDDKQYLAALKDFKATGNASDLLQSSKLDALRRELNDIDLDHITAEQYKHLKENYIERHEYHHKESISSNPAKQSDADNVDVLRTSEHDQRHTHVDENGNETVNYREPVKEKPNNRNQDLRNANKKRVFRNELHGLGIAVAIGAGIGMTIGFVTALAQSGVTPDSLKLAFAEGAKGGVESGLLSAAGYGIGRTVGEVASQAAAGTLENLGLTITDNISKMVNIGVIGTLTVVVFSAYQFVKLKCHGVATKDALIQVGKQALFSFSLLAITVAAQGVFGGPAGIIVSIATGIVVVSYSVIDAAHKRSFAEQCHVATIEEYARLALRNLNEMQFA